MLDERLDSATSGLPPAVWEAVRGGNPVDAASALVEAYGESAIYVAADALWHLTERGHFDPETITFLAVIMRLLRPAEHGVTVH